MQVARTLFQPALSDGREAMASATKLGDVDLAYQAQLALAAGNRQINVPLGNVKAGDVLSVRPLAPIPDGYDLGAAFCTTDGTLTAIVAHPALALLQQFTIPVRVFKIITG